MFLVSTLSKFQSFMKTEYNHKTRKKLDINDIFCIMVKRKEDCRMKKFLLYLAALCLMFSLEGCKWTSKLISKPETVPKISLTAFELTENIESPVLLHPGETFKMPGLLVSCCIENEKGIETMEVSYNIKGVRETDEDEQTQKIYEKTDRLKIITKSSDSAVITIDNDGTVTAVASGKAEILVEVYYGEGADFGQTAEFSVPNKSGAPCRAAFVVAVALQSVSAKESITLEVGKSANADALVFPENATDFEISYKSSDEAIVTVDGSGNIKGVSAGEATVTVTAINTVTKQTLTAQTKISVKKVSSSVSHSQTPSTGSKNTVSSKAENTLPGNASLKKGMTAAEYAQAYTMAEKVVKDCAKPGLGKVEQLKLVLTELGNIHATTEHAESGAHYADIYGFFVLRRSSCAASVRAVGICCTIMGIPYEHVNENKWEHQWARVNVDGEYWCCDADIGLACIEPGPYKHPWIG